MSIHSIANGVYEMGSRALTYAANNPNTTRNTALAAGGAFLYNEHTKRQALELARLEAMKAASSRMWLFGGTATTVGILGLGKFLMHYSASDKTGFEAVKHALWESVTKLAPESWQGTGRSAAHPPVQTQAPPASIAAKPPASPPSGTPSGGSVSFLHPPPPSGRQMRLNDELLRLSQNGTADQLTNFFVGKTEEELKTAFEQVDANGASIIHHAAASGNRDAMITLLDHEASAGQLFALDKRGKKPVDYVQTQHPEMKTAIESEMAKQNAELSEIIRRHNMAELLEKTNGHIAGLLAEMNTTKRMIPISSGTGMTDRTLKPVIVSTGQSHLRLMAEAGTLPNLLSATQCKDLETIKQMLLAEKTPVIFYAHPDTANYLKTLGPEYITATEKTASGKNGRNALHVTVEEHEKAMQNYDTACNTAKANGTALPFKPTTRLARLNALDPNLARSINEETGQTPLHLAAEQGWLHAYFDLAHLNPNAREQATLQVDGNKKTANDYLKQGATDFSHQADRASLKDSLGLKLPLTPEQRNKIYGIHYRAPELFAAHKKGSTEESVLHRALSNQAHMDVIKLLTGINRELLSTGNVSQDGLNALHHSVAQKCSPAVIQELAQYSALHTTQDGKNILHTALSSGADVDTMKLFSLNPPAEFTASRPDAEYGSILHAITEKTNTATFKHLAEKFPQLVGEDNLDSKGRNVLDAAISAQNKEAIYFLLSKNPKLIDAKKPEHLNWQEKHKRHLLKEKVSTAFTGGRTTASPSK